MNLSWKSIANNALHAVVLGKDAIAKVATVVGKEINTGIKLFLQVEPVAVAAVTPFFPEAAAVLGIVYKYCNVVEEEVGANNGATKAAKVQHVVDNAVIPMLQNGLAAVGKTIDPDAASKVATAMINAVVAENNAQAVITNLIATASASNTMPDPGALATAYQAASSATTAVTTAVAAFQTAISTVKANAVAQAAS